MKYKATYVIENVYSQHHTFELRSINDDRAVIKAKHLLDKMSKKTGRKHLLIGLDRLGKGV